MDLRFRSHDHFQGSTSGCPMDLPPLGVEEATGHTVLVTCDARGPYLTYVLCLSVQGTFFGVIQRGTKDICDGPRKTSHAQLFLTMVQLS